ncbi:hypothetical protein [Nocardia africana]|uniref:Uncharacterized protein n=1 Tax=Nocardia africana TaxID=134964 RepID=A0A378WRL9_9NOCA|nr:hypothetical protein [Nocardia africana]MCC3314735.1 hypothetical protein [Nocardia africana]SUA42983.1 Uncharacterised protein [Nocardia africana]
MENPSEVSFDVAHGDIAVSRQLRRSLETIKSAVTDPALRKQLDDVLSGRRSMRDFGTSDAFAGIMDSVPASQLNRALTMSEDERQALAQVGEQELESLRSDQHETAPTPPPENVPPAPSTAAKDTGSPVIPRTRKPNREQLYTPEEPDEDDLYFQQRRNQGWLE